MELGWGWGGLAAGGRAWWRGRVPGPDKEPFTPLPGASLRKGAKHFTPASHPVPAPRDVAAGRTGVGPGWKEGRFGADLLGPGARAAAARSIGGRGRKEGWPRLTPPALGLKLPSTHPAAWDPLVSVGGGAEAPGAWRRVEGWGRPGLVQDLPCECPASWDSSCSSPVTLPCWGSA